MNAAYTYPRMCLHIGGVPRLTIPGVFVHPFRSNPYTHSGVFVHPGEGGLAQLA